MTAHLHTLEQTLDLYLVRKAPAIPENWKEMIARFTPWITLIAIIIALPFIVLPLNHLGVTGFMFMIGKAVFVTTLVLQAVAIGGLFKRQARGWRYLFYATLLNAAYNIILFDLVSLFIGTLVSLYILFQIKTYYR